MPKIKKVPIAMQMEAVECGAACLCMVLAFYGKWIPLEKLRSDCGVSRDGSNAKNILQAARFHDLDANGYRMEVEDLKKATLPAIIHWNLNHFVVLNGFGKDYAVINDPGRGTVKVSMEEFDSAFTGIALLFQKTKSFVPEGKPKSVLGFAVKRLKGMAAAIFFVILVSAMVALLNAVTPLFSKIFVDDILSGRNPQWLMPFIGAMAFVLLMQFGLSAVQSLFWLRINGRFAITANAEFMWHVLRLPIDFFSQRFAGDIAMRQSSNEQIASTLIQKIAPVLINIVLLFFYLFFMIRYSLILTGIGVFAALLNIIMSRVISFKMLSLSRISQIHAGKLAANTSSGIEMIETIKASGAEAGFFENWAGHYANHHNAQVAISKATQYFSIIPGFLQQITNIAVLIVGVYLIMDGMFTIGMLLAFQGFTVAFLMPVSELLSIGETVVTMRADMERVEDVLNYQIDKEKDFSVQEPEKDPKRGKSITGNKLSGAMEIKDITFGYHPLAEPLIRDFSLKIKPYSMVAIVGVSGCGKSTLAKLITGLYKPWSGSILFDGIGKDEIDSYVFKSSVAMVDQDITLFEDSISDNIRMWDQSIEDFAVIMAAREADIHDMIVGRHEGYAHQVLEGGKNFSGGQRQRIEIARVLAMEPTIIILDEATSALDAKTEAVIMENIRAIHATCVIIAHRLSTIRDCEQIIVLDKGVIAEQGTHDELYKKGGKYTQMISVE